MEQFAVCAKNEEKVTEICEIAEVMGFRHAPQSPDFAISVGGDGTFLIAERQLPGIPKLLVRDSLICYKCHDEPLDEMLDIIRRGDWQIKEMMKLRGCSGNWSHLATNEIVVRNVDPRHALRFHLHVDGDPIDDLLIGDGILCCTPFGSTGYYRSITGDTISEGVGLAFNNLTEDRESQKLPPDSRITLDIVRGRAHLTADNASDMAVIKKDERIHIQRSTDHRARLVGHVH